MERAAGGKSASVRFSDRFDCLTARARELSATAAPGPALTAWLRELVEFTGTYRGLTAVLMLNGPDVVR
ncbi:hypothetical protein [Candidatus Protofrankia californiensis]|uniref:hypothetical protein n=1 Tax=Candidatus Protofrankia californiensis TaxID=1839754 RepID=UPI001F4A091A|nr:hypothetical protein [Candidatus Protofrankia californiensis]